MGHAGLDTHSTRVTSRVLNGTARAAHRSQARGIAEMLTGIEGPPDRFEVDSEAGCGCGHDHDRPQPPAAPALAPTPVGCG